MVRLTPKERARRETRIEQMLKGPDPRYAVIAKAVGCSTGDIVRVKRKLGLTPRARTPAPPGAGKKNERTWVDLVATLKRLGVTELHYANGKLAIYRVQTIEVK